MRVTALCKTWRGEEWVRAMIDSIYNYVDNIVFVHSGISWAGEHGNTVRAVVSEWKQKFDVLGKIIEINFNSSEQSKQYAQGLKYIKENLQCEFIMLCDTDEVWDAEHIESALSVIGQQRYTHINAFCADGLYTYIKSPFYRVDPIEQLNATVFIRNVVDEISGVRGNKVSPRMVMDGVRFHHFTDVRRDPNDVFNKILLSNKADGVPAVDLKEWKKEKWANLPNSTDLHHSRGYESNWKGVKIVTKADLPAVFSLYEHPIIKMFEMGSVQSLFPFELPPIDLCAGDIKLLMRYSDGADFVVELGTYKGGSSILLSHGAKKVWTIDVHEDAHLIGDGRQHFESVWKEIPHYYSDVLKTVSNRPNITAFKNVTAGVITPGTPVDMLFIDADHTYTGVKADFDWWFPYVENGGYILFHDSLEPQGGYGWEGVYRFVQECKQNANLKFIEIGGLTNVFRKAKE